jgi:4-amino-4-deoxy-L-arabinose transferase-like glycosyltransferase
VNSPVASARFGPRGSTFVSAALGLVAVVLGAVAQLLVRNQPWLSLAGFAIAAVLIALTRPRWPEPADTGEPPLAPPPPQSFWLLIGTGVLLGLGAAVAVYLYVAPWITRSLWVAALCAFGAAAWCARLPRAPSGEPAWKTAAAVALLLVVCSGTFAWHLTTMPPEVHGDDAEVGLDAIRLLENKPFNLFEAGWFELPRFHAFPTAVGLKVFGINLLGLRATSAVFGGATVLLLFFLTRRLWGFEVGLLAALLLASQRFFIHLSRTGYHYIDTPFLAVLALLLFLRVWREGRLGSAVWCGIALGLGIQTYYASRLVPVLLAVTFGLWLIGSSRRHLSRRLRDFAIIVVVAVVTAAPIFGYFAHRWGAFWERTEATSVFTPEAREHLSYGYGTNRLSSILVIQGRAAFSLFNAKGDNSIQYGYDAPLLEPVSAVLFVLGMALMLASARRRRSQMVLLWVLVPLVAGAMLTIDTPFYPRISGLVPFAALTIALALEHLLNLLRRVVADQLGRRLVSAAAALVLVVVFTNNVRSYFFDYAPNHRDSPAREIGEWIVANAKGRTTYMVGGAPTFYIHHGTISFIAHGYEMSDIEDLGAFLKTQRFDPGHSAFIIMPRGEPLIPRLRAAVGPLRVQRHLDRRGDLSFLSAVPRAGGARAPAPPVAGPAQEPAHPGLGAALYWVSRIVLAGLVLAAVILVASGLRRRRGPRLPSPRRAALRARGASLQTLVFGDGGGEIAPPRALVLGLLTLIVVLALVLRVYHLSTLPAGFYCDEAGNGYNATSILRTGRDETGAFLPLYVWSFGVSYKNPVFVYSSMLPIGLLGPTELAVRLTSALYGTATVAALFWLGRALAGPWVGLSAALLLAVCPWHLHFSRIAFELICFPLFFVLGFTGLVRWTQGRRSLPRAALFLGLSLYTYAPAKLFVPLFIAGFAYVNLRLLRARWREALLAAVVLVATAAPVLVFDMTHPEQAGLYFRRTTILESGAGTAELAETFLHNYSTFLSPKFLLYKGGDRIARHSVGDHGELYPFFAPLLVVGALVAIFGTGRNLPLVLLWILIYPLAPALMNEIPSASRGFVGSVGLCLLAALGAGAILRWAARLAGSGRRGFFAQVSVFALGVAILAPQVLRYWHTYTQQYPLDTAKFYYGFQFGHRQVVDYFRAHYDEYDDLVLSQRMSNQANIFLDFYDGLKRPAVPGRVPPFLHGEKMRVGWVDELGQYRDAGRMLFAVRPEEVGEFEHPKILQRIIAPDGSAAFVLVAANRLKNFLHDWRVAGPYAPEEFLDPPVLAPEAELPEAPGGRHWRIYQAPMASVGLNDFFSENADNTCAWAINFAQSDADRAVLVHAGFDDEGQVWINGEQVPLHTAKGAEDWLADNLVGRARLHEGRNLVAVHSCDEVADWRFYFRLSAVGGGPLTGVGWQYGGS